ncbi:MAG: segregation/condensation protein A [Oscillospiraceae bacterium]|nr:segregation/condensation protein A [Oscillospiraceae bacterium]
MEKLSFKLEVFEGPLDLLLHLISKHKLNINDIEISKLLEQYLKYLEDCMEHDLELAGEFLEMAARLIYIKTVSLLPVPEEAEAEKKELQGTLIEYSQCKKAAGLLRKLFCADDIFVRKQAKIKADLTYAKIHESTVLSDALKASSMKKLAAMQPQQDDRFKVIVKHKMYSVTTKVIYILRMLYNSGRADMDKLYENVFDRSERVATFLAVLELTKSGRIYINDDNTEITFIGKQGRTRV